MKFILILLAGTLISITLQSQVIWSEDFNSYPDGTTAGPAGKWTSVCGACLAGDYFEVQSGAFRAGDVNDFSTWETESIDISGCGSVDISLTATENGDHEGLVCACGINIDYFDVSYSVDGGAFFMIENWNGDGEIGHTLSGDSQGGVFNDADWGTTVVTATGISGSTLVLRVEMRNTAGTEELVLDDVSVTCINPLPVELLRFEGKLNHTEAHISWETISEINISHFEVERSLNGVDFEKVIRESGRGVTAGPQSYEVSTDQAGYEPVYYRLRLVDFDGSFSYSEVISLSRPAGLHALFPNPFSDRLMLNLEANADVSIRSALGNWLISFSAEKGQINLAPYMSDFSNGLFLIQISSQGKVETQRVVKITR